MFEAREQLETLCACEPANAAVREGLESLQQLAALCVILGDAVLVRFPVSHLAFVERQCELTAMELETFARRLRAHLTARAELVEREAMEEGRATL